VQGRKDGRRGEKFGHIGANSGRAHAPAGEALELRRLAAEDYLKSGRDARGLDVMRAVLDDVGLPYPRTKQRALASLLFSEARLRVAPLRGRLRAAQTIDASHLARIDVAFAAGTGLSQSDPLRGADYASKGLLLALEAGEPARLCRALAVAAGNVATRGERERSRGRAEALVRAAERIAVEIDEPRCARRRSSPPGRCTSSSASGAARAPSSSARSAIFARAAAPLPGS